MWPSDHFASDRPPRPAANWFHLIQFGLSRPMTCQLRHAICVQPIAKYRRSDLPNDRLGGGFTPRRAQTWYWPRNKKYLQIFRKVIPEGCKDSKLSRTWENDIKSWHTEMGVLIWSGFRKFRVSTTLFYPTPEGWSHPAPKIPCCLLYQSAGHSVIRHVTRRGKKRQCAALAAWLLKEKLTVVRRYVCDLSQQTFLLRSGGPVKALLPAVRKYAHPCKTSHDRQALVWVPTTHIQGLIPAGGQTHCCAQAQVFVSAALCLHRLWHLPELTVTADVYCGVQFASITLTFHLHLECAEVCFSPTYVFMT
jgi:hypothetical protein